MELPFLSSNPAKRPFEAHDSIPTPYAHSANGAFKRRPKPPPPPIVLSPGHAAFRLLCPISKIGGIIGKSGSVVNLIRNETGAKIRVEDPVPACDERVILVVGPTAKMTGAKAHPTDGDGTDGGEGGRDASPAQEALVRVFGRVLEVDAEMEVSAGGGAVSCRLLVPTGQVGPVMGKGGKVIEKIRKESGAKIRVLPREQLPACALPSDEVVQITGDAGAVKKALLAVSCCIQENSPTDRAQLVVSRPVAAPHGAFPDAQGEHHLHRGSLLPPTPGGYVDYAARGRPLPTPVDGLSMLDQKKAQQEVAFRFLCSNDKVGGVIGKGGTIVKALQNETGACISVGSSVAESEERVITVSAMEDPESRYSPAQNAVVRVFVRSVEAGMEKGLDSGLGKGAHISARLLVPSNQIGCLMGKGGTVIAEMRKVTGAGIRIIGGDQVPKCASENDEVVQAVGGLDPRSIPIPDIGRSLPSLRGGMELGSGSKSAIVMNTTMEIVVPEHVIGAVYGENGSNLSRIRQISGAKVIVHDPRPGTRDGMVIISGTPDQTQAAQSLLQAFILS
ncbi:KH domain-containing protein HEN4-like isoform X2 [Magnolia sinica]|uniref:KH domain-containing protein HEN4-like isoform X2 n=1 Tax=Magnolia sinica TaxID=86752 RepID=UPI00265B0EBE|nr:KH domain-containing protein HEN4-like isoform X2 [Magnolia sinica]